MDMDKIRAAFTRKGFSFQYFDTAEQAKTYLVEQCAGKRVSFGGSMTLDGMGVYEALQGKADVHWHWKGDAFDQTPDIYLTSANGVAATGELVNIDGAGNRVSATLYGPKEVLFVCGINKVAEDLSAAIQRAEQVAAPKNAMRFDTGSACQKAGGDKCYHCTAPGSICRAMVIHRGPMRSQTRCELVLIGEELGY